MQREGAHHALEVIVEDSEHDGWRKTVRKLGETMRVRYSDNRVGGFVGATIDLAIKDPYPCAVAQIGVHQVAGHGAHGNDFEQQLEGWHGLDNPCDLCVTEFVRVPSCPGAGIGLAVGKRHPKA